MFLCELWCKLMCLVNEVNENVYDFTELLFLLLKTISRSRCCLMSCLATSEYDNFYFSAFCLVLNFLTPLTSLFSKHYTETRIWIGFIENNPVNCVKQVCARWMGAHGSNVSYLAYSGHQLTFLVELSKHPLWTALLAVDKCCRDFMIKYSDYLMKKWKQCSPFFSTF